MKDKDLLQVDGASRRIEV